MEFYRKKKDMSFVDEKHVGAKEVEIILTQKCNLACEHCMRGDATNKEITEDVFDAIFDKLFYIDNLSLGGGEISLSPHLIRLLTSSLKKHNTILHGINFSTNGTHVSDEFLDALDELRQYIISCNDKPAFFVCPDPNDKHEPVYVCFSFDDYHLLSMLNQGITLEQLYDNAGKYYNRFSVNAVRCRLSCDVDVYDTGRAKNLNSEESVKKPLPDPSKLVYPYMVSKKAVILGGILTFSCDGEVIPPNIEFSQEKQLSWGNIKTEPLSEILSNMSTKKVSWLTFDGEYRKLFKLISAPKRAWKKYFKDYGNKKLNTFYQKSKESAEKQKQ